MSDIKSLLERQQNSMLADLSRPSAADVQPLHDWVLVKKDQIGKTQGGLHVPQSVQDKEADGTVVAVGPGSWRGNVLVPPTVKPGDRVMCMPGAENLRMPTDSSMMLIREADILAIRKPAPPAPGALQ